MGFEPKARRRLWLVVRTTSDPGLRHELENALEEETMALVPSVDLARAIARCPHCRSTNPPADRPSREGLCEVHRGRWNLEACTEVEVDREALMGDGLESLMRRALTSKDGGAQFLAAFERQVRALDAVWEAHRRGAVNLPAAVAEKVEDARTRPPNFLAGGAANGLPANGVATNGLPVRQGVVARSGV